MRYFRFGSFAWRDQEVSQYGGWTDLRAQIGPLIDHQYTLTHEGDAGTLCTKDLKLPWLYRDSNSLLEEKVAERRQGEERPQELYFNPSGLRQLQASPSREMVSWGAQIPAPAWFR